MEYHCFHKEIDENLLESQRFRVWKCGFQVKPPLQTLIDAHFLCLLSIAICIVPMTLIRQFQHQLLSNCRVSVMICAWCSGLWANDNPLPPAVGLGLVEFMP